MRKELDDALCEKYPEIFKNRNAPKTQTAMCWGFECGDGWYDLIDVLCCQIQNHVQWQKQTGSAVEYPIAAQVKEKFGTLRFYLDGDVDDTIFGMVRLAESMSGRICEECGKPGKIRKGSWLSVRCDDCAGEK